MTISTDERARQILEAMEELAQSSIHPACVEIIADALEATERRARHEAIEEAAKVADRLADYDTRKKLGATSVITASQIATAIRDLKDDAAT